MYGTATNSGFLALRTNGSLSISFKDCAHFSSERIERNRTAPCRCVGCTCCITRCSCCCSLNSTCRGRLSSSLLYMLWQSSRVPLSPSRRAIWFERKRYYCRAPAHDRFHECSTKKRVGGRNSERSEKIVHRVNRGVGSSNVDEVLSLLSQEAGEEIRYMSRGVDLSKSENLESCSENLHFQMRENISSERLKNDLKVVSDRNLRKDRLAKKREVKEIAQVRSKTDKSYYQMLSSSGEYQSDNNFVGMQTGYLEEPFSRIKDRRCESDLLESKANVVKSHADSVEVEKRVLNEFSVTDEEHSVQRSDIQWDMRKKSEKKLEETQINGSKLNPGISRTQVDDYERGTSFRVIPNKDEVSLSSLSLDERKEKQFSQTLVTGAEKTDYRKMMQETDLQELSRSLESASNRKILVCIEEEKIKRDERFADTQKVEKFEDSKEERNVTETYHKKTPSSFEVMPQERVRYEMKATDEHELRYDRNEQSVVGIGSERENGRECRHEKKSNLQSASTEDEQKHRTAVGFSSEAATYMSNVNNQSVQLTQIVADSQNVTNASSDVANVSIVCGEKADNSERRTDRTVETIFSPPLTMASHSSSSTVILKDEELSTKFSSGGRSERVPSVKGMGNFVNLRQVTTKKEPSVSTVINSSSSSDSVSYQINVDGKTNQKTQVRVESQDITNVSLNVINLSVVCGETAESNFPEQKVDLSTDETVSSLQSTVESQGLINILDVTDDRMAIENENMLNSERFSKERRTEDAINLQPESSAEGEIVETVDSISSSGAVFFESNIGLKRISVSQLTEESHGITNESLNATNVSVVRVDTTDRTKESCETEIVIQGSKPYKASPIGFSSDGTISGPQLTLEDHGLGASSGSVLGEIARVSLEASKFDSNLAGFSAKVDLDIVQPSVKPFDVGVDSIEQISHGTSIIQSFSENVTASSDEIQKQKQRSITDAASAQSDGPNLGISSNASGMTIPSERLWDTKPDSIEEPNETESLEETVSNDKIAIKRSGKNLWNLIANVVRLRWGARGESSKITSSGGKNSSDDSNSSETWFSGNEHDDSGDGVSKDKVQTPEVVSDNLQMVASSTEGQGKILYPQKQIKQDLSEVNVVEIKPSLRSSQSTSYEKNYPETGESNVEVLPLGSGMISVDALQPNITTYGTVTEADVAREDTDNSSSSSVPETMNVMIPQSSEAMLMSEGPSSGLKKLRRTKQVLRERFNSWEESYVMDTEQRKNDEMFMKEALIEAKKAGDTWEVPVGAVLVQNGNIIARGHNLVEELRDSTAHAEMLCIRKASNELNSWRLADTTLYVTLEPCPMCAGAILQARVHTLVWGAPNKLLGADGSWIRLFRGGEDSATNESKNDPPVHPFHPNMKIRRGILASECADVMQQFFQLRRRKRSKTEEDQRSQSSSLSIAHRPTKFLTRMHDIFHSMICM